jgi:LysM repeat protein
VWRVLIGLVAVIAAVAGGGTPAARSPAHLTIDTSTGSPQTVLVPTEATLTCDHGAHATGFLRNAPGPACALVRRGRLTEIAAEHQRARLCSDIYGGPQRARITGTVGRQRISISVDRNDGCGIADWDALRKLLGVPERTGAIPRRQAPATTTTTLATYSVQRGETLTAIAKRFHTSIGAIVAQNRLRDPDHLAEGQTLVMPPPSAVRIEVALVRNASQPKIRFTLVGADPNEVVTFVITSPDGSTYTGSPHVASASGVVKATYTTSLSSGTYRLTATGERGTTALIAFHRDPPD